MAPEDKRLKNCALLCQSNLARGGKALQDYCGDLILAINKSNLHFLELRPGTTFVQTISAAYRQMVDCKIIGASLIHANYQHHIKAGCRASRKIKN